MYVFNLPTYGKPFLSEVIEAKDIQKKNLKTLQGVVGGLISKINVEEMKVYIHPMFSEENEKWNIAHALLWNQHSKVWINDNGANECCGNMGVIIGNPIYRVGGAPHLWGNVAITISQTVYEKICDKPLEYWKEEDDDDEEYFGECNNCGIEANDLAKCGQCEHIYCLQCQMEGLCDCCYEILKEEEEDDDDEDD